MSSATDRRSLRESGTLIPFLQPMLANELHGVIFAVAALPRLAPDFFVQFLVFPDFQTLAHVFGQQAD
jgi:hypothetical protein